MFTDYSLPERVQNALADKGFTVPTPIQTESLPHALAGKDILGQARTGTGKTLAFGLPIASHLEADDTRGRAPRALVLTPTRELALQVSGELEWAAPHLKIVTVYGGTGYGQQASDLKRGCDVVVATPGRAIDYQNRNILDLSRVRVVVLDEADEMLNMGFEEDVETLLGATPRERQTLLFSATLPHWAKRLAGEYLNNPVHVNVMKDEEVSYQEIAIETSLQNRLGVLSDILHAHHGEKAIIFTHTKAEVDRLAKELSLMGHGAEAIHGDLNQTQRERVIGRFRSGQVSALVGTNVAARGLDIPEVDLVVHYRMPVDTEAYQHRSGRTGRAGREGTVVVLYGPRERRDLANIERAVSRRFRISAPPTPEAIQGAKLSGLIGNARAQSAADKNAWRDVAQGLIDKQDTDTLAGLLAVVLGGAPAQRSLLTSEEGWFTLELVGDFRNVGQVVRVLKDAGAGDIGRVQLGRSASYADVKPGEAAQLLRENPDLRKAETVPVEQAAPEERSKRKPRGSGKPRRRAEARY
ncbi:MAG TPA: DEAD/DEAH box helicase [Chloroflexota bacterium]|nr:DEAD/DEAH box helicase [Chloroflexota bacterium]